MIVVALVILIWFSFIGSIVHAARRNRWGWVIFIILMPPIGVIAYWLVGAGDRQRPRAA